MRKEFKTVAKQAQEQGWVVQRRTAHYRLVSPSGAMVSFACTASDHRALANTVAKLRRTGEFTVNRHGRKGRPLG